MIRPVLLTRVEQANELAALNVHGPYFAPFVSVALETSPNEILVRVLPTMLFRYHMVRLVLLHSMILVKQAVLATEAGACRDPLALPTRDSHGGLFTSADVS